MIQYILVIAAVAVSVIYLIFRFKIKKGCGPAGCAGCPHYEGCGKIIKKSRP